MGEPTLDDRIRYGMQLSHLLDEAILEAGEVAANLARAESEYRKARGACYIGLPRSMTVDQAKAYVDSDTADLRETRDALELRRKLAIEAIRARRTQISLVQTEINARREDMAFHRTGPDTT